jgi:hypothetical protein
VLIGRTAVDSVLTAGFAHVTGQFSEEVCLRLQKPDEIDWRPVAPKVGVVAQDGWFVQMNFCHAPSPVQEVGREIYEALVGMTGLSDVPMFNEVSWQRYDPARGFIDPHRDQAYYTGVIAIITLVGQAEFAVLRSREPPVVVEHWLTGGGDLVLLRGAELAGPGSRGPLHSVGPPETERQSLAFRHDLRGPGGRTGT